MPQAIRWSGAVGTLLLVAAAGVVGWDWMESGAARRDAATWALKTRENRASALAATAKAAYSPRLPAAFPLRIETYHPLNAILIIDSAQPSLGEGRVRFDVPAVWGGP